MLKQIIAFLFIIAYLIYNINIKENNNIDNYLKKYLNNKNILL